MKFNLADKVFTTVSEIIDKENKEAYIIGGWVRDLILNRHSKDVDIVVVGSGIELANKLAKKLDTAITVTVFKNFGTAMFKYQNIEYEFVGARRESYNRNSRNPIVEDGTLEDDLHRRDLTINALAISLQKNNFGELIDKFDAIKDIENKIIKTPTNPDITFSDDPLRMLRAIRFATQLNFNIEEKTLQAIKDNVQRISIITKERINDELNKIIISKKPSIGFLKLAETNLLEIIFPELYNLKGVEIVNNVGHKDNFFHTVQVLDNIAEKTDKLWLRWAALLHDIAKPITKKFINNAWTFHGHEMVGAKIISNIFNKMKMPTNENLKYIQKLVGLHLRPIILSSEEVTDAAVRRLIVEAGEDLDDLMTLCEADITSKNDEKVQRYMTNFKLVRQKIKELEEKDALRNWKSPISGEQIMAALNLQPSKTIGIIKEMIKDAILDGKIENNYTAAENYMYKLIQENNFII